MILGSDTISLKVIVGRTDNTFGSRQKLVFISNRVYVFNAVSYVNMEYIK